MKYDAIGIASLVGWMATLAAFTVFSVSYAIVAWRYWWRSPAGRWLMTVSAGLASTLGLSVLTLVIGPDHPSVRLLTAIWGAWFAAAGVWINIELHRQRRKAKRTIEK